ncbi:putative peptidoglycan glycosyltransferase FtsW [Microbacterium capsulatum]|uniref:Probable peptidoglycan glycosyltransferase FtsW n=1 Tax=Microbacterium capsulatum TaxID=3041921 RepID=A0ABU0XGY5_9MICO|nr:putative peptidoglycan glycosyltransferase FtsW [Microbacterium sp. ASV81]MDQ4212960.1 putative peptidoglycan glycosyltransferase FtsW [Microbacterium sp. ASV81]
MTQVAGRPTEASTAERGSGLAARVRLGSVFQPVPNEFVLIASTALLLTIFGLVMVLSASSANAVNQGDGPYAIVLKQALIAVIGVPLMFLMSRLPIGFYKKMAWPVIIVAIVVQMLVFTPLGVENDGNTNWLLVGGQLLQPSEFIKLALALWAAFILWRKEELLGRWKHVYIPLLPVGFLAIGTVYGGGDLGTSMVLFLLLLGTMFFSGVRLRIFILPMLAILAAVLVFALTNERRRKLIFSMFSSESDASCYLTGCYQQVHAIWGMANGGIFGLGLGNSHEKYGWLPAASNDYIFAIVGEELGLIGCAVVLALFVLFAIGVFHIIRRTDDLFVRIAAGGIVVWILSQALINIGVVLRIFPVLGVPLPFMSQGGTSLLSVLLACGVLLSFARTLPADGAKRTTGPARSGKVTR